MECSHCSKKAVAEVKYAGRAYCKSHFCRMIWRRFKKTFNEEKMVKHGQNVVVAVSGGKSSIVCLHFMSALVRPLKLNMKALVVDEGMPRKQIVLSKKACEQVSIPCTVVKHAGPVDEDILKELSREMGADVLVTGHNLDDEAVSILAGLMEKKIKLRGRNKEKRPILLKPMRGILERELAVYALLSRYEADFLSKKDESGRPFARKLMHYLNRVEDRFPGTKISIASTFSQMVRAGK